MLFSVFYLSLFLSVGLLSARRAVPDGSAAVPDGSAAVIVPLGCGFGVSLLAVLPALFAVVLGFTLPAVALAAAAAAGIGASLLYRGTRLRGMAKDPDSGALWACLLPVVLITLYLLHTHVLHLVDGAYHTGQSCYGDMPMHLGFIKYIAQSGEFLPRYPLLGGTHRFGYPFLCETVSSVFVVLGADLRTAYLLPMLPAFLSVYGMFWQLARRVTDSVGKACLAFYLFFMGSGLGFVYFLGSADSFAGIFTGFYTTPTNFVEKNIEWVNPIVDLLIPQRATLFGWCVLLPAVYLLWRFCYEGERRLWPWLTALVLPLPLLHTHSALALVLLCLVGGVYTLAQGPRRKTLLPWLGLAAVCGAAWLCQMLPTVLAQSLDGQHMLRLHFNWINGQDDGTLRDNYFWFYIKNIGLVYLLLIPAFLRAKPKQRWLYGGGLADHIDENAGSDALFLTSDSHLTPVFALAGRRILCGSGSYVYYHGMDYSAEYNAMRALYETPDEDTLAAWDIGYAVFDSSVYAKFAADESWYAARYDVWYENAACRVYKIK